MRINRVVAMKNWSTNLIDEASRSLIGKFCILSDHIFFDAFENFR